jgi:Ca-activated chloride channel family protein
LDYFLRFAYPAALYILIPVVLLLLFARLRLHKTTIYRYTLTSQLKKNHISSRHPYKIILFILRLLVLLILAFLIAKPQLVDSHSKVKVHGIDIVLTIDVSGSMQIQDDKQDTRPRVEIAKTEAIRFIDKRTNDAIGLVIFGQDAVSRCPLTLDKFILKDIVHDLQIGVIDPQGTVLSTALITAINRLKNSTAKSKVIILLTDGEPSENDIQPHVAIEAAKKMGIKVYTIGIGSDKEVRMMHPLYGAVMMPKVNADLLTLIAQQTGGKFFMARNAKDMRTIYDTIDSLEKTEVEAPVFSNYWDIFIPFVWLALSLLIVEILLSCFVWFSL